MKKLMRCTLAVGLFGACLLCGAVSVGPGSSAQFGLKPIPAGAVHHAQAPRVRLWDSTDTNWSGYAVQTNLDDPAADVVTDVSGTWVVPAVTGSGRTSEYSSTWVGIDGYSSDTVEQIGTEQDWTPRGPVYYAWIEMYPESSFEITGFAVSPGDVISAEVKFLGQTTEQTRKDQDRSPFRPAPPPRHVVQTYQLTISNVTKDVTSTRQIQMTSSAERSSAEWVMEAPSSGRGVLPLADFGTQDFTDCEATLSGHTGTITDDAWQNDPMTMATRYGVVKAVPSDLSDDGSTFEVTWAHQ